MLPKTLFLGTPEDKASLAHLSEASCESSSSKEEESAVVLHDDIDEKQRIFFQVQFKGNQPNSSNFQQQSGP